MTLLVRWIGTLGAAMLALALPVLAPAQADATRNQSSFTRTMGIDQKLGTKVPLDATFVDETGETRSFGSLLKGRPLLVLPFPLKKTAGCGVITDGLQTTLFKADHPNEHVLLGKKGANALAIGRTFDVVFLSLDPADRPTDAAQAKIDFQQKVDPQVAVEPVTALTGDAVNIGRMADALGFRFFHNVATGEMRNPTGSVLLTPDGRISSYTIGNEFPTKVLESDLEVAQAGRIGVPADESRMFGCVQLATSVIDRRGKIETLVTLFALLTLAIVVFWIGSMLRSERKGPRDLGGQPGGV